jgi:NTE family protein
MKKISLVLLILLIINFLIANERPKIALVLSGGGAKGISHIGTLKLLDEIGVEIDFIIGTSMGAVIGGLYASGHSALEIENIILNIKWSEILLDNTSRAEIHAINKKWLPTGNMYFYLNNSFKPQLSPGLITGNKIHLALVKETWSISHVKDFSTFPIPFMCVATDLITGELVLFKDGTLADVMRASSSFPSVFLPVEINGNLYIDGGISQNFPADIAQKLGYNIIIGCKTNTDLLKKEDMTSPLNVLTQTFNITIFNKQIEAEKIADIIISPNTDDISIIDFTKNDLLIENGYNEALKYKDFFISLAESQKEFNLQKNTIEKLPHKISFNAIIVKNNRYLSSSSIKNYLALNTDINYSRDEVIEAFEYAYASNLFEQIYPNIIKTEKGFNLEVYVKEKERKQMGFNLIYNQDDGLVAGVIFKFQNVLLKNSMLLINFQDAGKSAFEIDYSKAFLKDHNVYYRLFPYYKSENLYTYDEKYIKEKQIKLDEYGITGGVGFNLSKNSILEPFLYSYYLKYKKKIGSGDINNKFTKSSGLGLKFYYESFDDYPFYMKGTQIISKYTKSLEQKIAYTNTSISDVNYSKLKTTITYAYPFSNNFSLICGMEYGTFFKSVYIEQDPFYIGGLDNFLGLYSKEINPPYYRKANLGFRLKTFENIFFDLKGNIINYGDTDKLHFLNDFFSGYGIEIGYKSFLGPARVSLAMNKNNKFFSYISFGYDYDAFIFSRR